jgi:hypothetical protein
MAQPGQWQVGQLYKGGLINGLPVWTQPGGQGTPVFPQPPTQFPTNYMGYAQVVMSYPALYQFGCLHFQNCPEIFSVYDPYAGVQVALLCCSQCSYIQEIFSPAETYWNYEDTPIVVG